MQIYEYIKGRYDGEMCFISKVWFESRTDIPDEMCRYSNFGNM